MTAKEYYLSRDQIKVGDKVQLNQLYQITDTYIVVGQLKPAKTYLGMYTEEGIILDIYDLGKEPHIRINKEDMKNATIHFAASNPVNWSIQ